MYIIVCESDHQSSQARLVSTATAHRRLGDLLHTGRGHTSAFVWTVGLEVKERNFYFFGKSNQCFVNLCL